MFDGELVDGTVNPTSGTLASNSLGFRSDYIDISKLNMFTLSGLSKEGKSFISFYDKNYIYISRTGGGNQNQIIVRDIPSNSKYCIITQYSFNDTNIRDCVKFSINLQLEESIFNKGISCVP